MLLDGVTMQNQEKDFHKQQDGPVSYKTSFLTPKLYPHRVLGERVAEEITQLLYIHSDTVIHLKSNQQQKQRDRNNDDNNKSNTHNKHVAFVVIKTAGTIVYCQWKRYGMYKFVTGCINVKLGTRVLLVIVIWNVIVIWK